MNDRDWKITLESGEWAEDMIAEYLKESGYEIVSFHKGKEYDILIKKDKEIWIEVKADFTNYIDTLNIEYESDGTPSGISITKAEYYFLFQPKNDELIIVKVNQLKEAIKDQQYNYKHQRGSHANLASMYHFNKEKINYQKKIKIDWRKNKYKSIYPLPQKLKYS
jgi:hypothetical protein